MSIFSGDFSAARALFQQGELEQALAEVDRVVGLFGKSLEALELQTEIREAIVAKNRSPEAEAEIWLNRGNKKYMAGDMVGVIASYDQALKIKPDYHGAWANRSIAAFASRGQSAPNSLTLKHPKLNQHAYPGQLASLTTGLLYCPAETHPLAHSILQRRLGDAHWDYAKTQESPRPYWREALKAYNKSLAVLPEDAYEARLDTFHGLIRAHLAFNETVQARHYQTRAITIFNIVRNKAPDKTAFDEKYTNISRTEIDLLIGENNAIKAFEQAEFYKNRALTWILDDRKVEISSLDYRSLLVNFVRESVIVYWHLSNDALTTFIISWRDRQPFVLPVDRYKQAIALEKLINEYKQNYLDYRQLPKDTKPEQRANHPWRLKLASSIAQLKQILKIDTIENYIVENRIANAKNIILLPHRDLHLLPIHATFSNHFTCTYLPSLQIGLTQPSFDPPTAHILLNIDDPKIADQPPLIYSRLESAIVRTLCNTQTTHLQDTAATHANTIAQLTQPHTIFHFSGHGSYNQRHPENSALGLTDQPLTAKTLASLDLSTYDLISLAACETGITGKNTIATEYVGLTSACLKATARNVLSTLWQVNELSSTWLIIRFYQEYLAGQSPAEALAIAQTWLQTLTYSDLIPWLQTLQQQENLGNRWQKELNTQAQLLREEMGTMGAEHRPYAHPFHWSGYIITGRD